MYKKIFLPFVLTFISFLFILVSCSEPNVVENKTNNLAKDNILSLGKTSDIVKPKGKIIGYEIVEVNGKKKKIPIYYDPTDTSDFGIKALACDYYSVNRFVFDHYEPVSGKSLGIMNQKPDLKNAYDLHNTWGFNGYKVNDFNDKNNKINIGYNPANLMVGVPLNNGQFTIPSGTFNKYYIDEPLERVTITWENAVILAYSLPSGSELFMSSYRDDPSTRIWYSSLMSATSNTRMMCDQYYDGTILYGHDQRAYWTWFKNNYGSSRATAHWMHILIDGIQGDFNILFGKANNLGINSIWLYAGDADNKWPGITATLNSQNYSTYINHFCYSAFQYGWLRRFEKLYKYMYHCPDYFGDPCYCSENETGWQLAWIQYLGTYEIYP